MPWSHDERVSWNRYRTEAPQWPAITTEAELRERYGFPHDRAVLKEATALHAHHIRFIELSPFFALSSTGPDGRGDVSPRGEAPGFVHVLDDKTLAVPDRPGNNRLDTLTNVLANPNVGLMFLLPGVNEILRVNGKAELRDDAGLMDRFLVKGKPPRLVMLVHVGAGLSALRESFDAIGFVVGGDESPARNDADDGRNAARPDRPADRTGEVKRQRPPATSPSSTDPGDRM